MKRPFGHGVVLCGILLFESLRADVPLRQTASGVERTDRAVNAEIEAVLERYVRAVNSADKNLLREIWEPGNAASYVNPTQRLGTWEELERFWRDFLAGRFSAREFKPDRLTIRHVGDVAWVLFNWEFKATLKTGQPYQSRGWETQVYRRTDRGWRIAHAHYSALAPGQ